MSSHFLQNSWKERRLRTTLMELPSRAVHMFIPNSRLRPLWTTPSDIARYAIGVQQALSGKSTLVLSAAITRAMLTPAHNQHAVGPAVGGITERKFFRHGGANAGYRCFFVAYQSGDGVVIMTNSDSGDALIPELLRTIAHEYGWADFAPPERALVELDPQSFDRYVGAYQFESGATATFWRDGTHIYSRLWGQPVVELFPMSEREYFVKVVDARWRFSIDANSVAAVLYQNGQEQSVKRMNEAEGRLALEASVAAERRFKEQTAAPGTEAALRRLIAGLSSGKPAYEEMSPAFAEITRLYLSQLQAPLARLGAINAISFKGVGPAGADIYDVKFQHDAREFRILLQPDGRIHAAQFSP